MADFGSGVCVDAAALASTGRILHVFGIGAQVATAGMAELQTRWTQNSEITDFF